MERLGGVKHVFLLNQECIGGEKNSKKGTDVVVEILVQEIGVASNDGIPGVFEIAAENVASFLVQFIIMKIKVRGTLTRQSWI